MEIINRIEIVPINQIKPYHRNVRKNDITVEKLVQIIPKVGFNVPVVLDRNNVIVKGHSRWKAAIKLGMKALPCVYSDADEETIKLDRLSDNKVQEFTQWDDELLKSELVSLNLPFDFNLRDLNFKFELPSFETYVPPSIPHYVPQPNTEDYQYPSPQPAGGPEAVYYSPSPGYVPPEQLQPSQPYITPQDVASTVPQIVHDYIECMCPNCGHQFYKRA